MEERSEDRIVFFFNCVAERAVKPCRSSRSSKRGGMTKSNDTCKTGSKHQNPSNNNNNNNNNNNTPTNSGKCQWMVRHGEQKVKRPKLSCVELHEEAKSIPCPAQLGMKLISHSIVFIPVPPSWIGVCARGGSIVIVERCITNIR